jgi:hypothetical protein
MNDRPPIDPDPAERLNQVWREAAREVEWWNADMAARYSTPDGKINTAGMPNHVFDAWCRANKPERIPEPVKEKPDGDPGGWNTWFAHSFSVHIRSTIDALCDAVNEAGGQLLNEMREEVLTQHDRLIEVASKYKDDAVREVLGEIDHLRQELGLQPDDPDARALRICQREQERWCEQYERGELPGQQRTTVEQDIRTQDKQDLLYRRRELAKAREQLDALMVQQSEVIALPDTWRVRNRDAAV